MRADTNATKCEHETYFDERGERCKLCHVYVKDFSKKAKADADLVGE